MQPSCTILLVQPYDEFREMYAGALRREGMSVIALPSADGAIRSAIHADVIVVDLDVGLITGVNQALPAKPIMVLTTSASAGERIWAEVAGCRALLTLPAPEELVSEIRRVLTTPINQRAVEAGGRLEQGD